MEQPTPSTEPTVELNHEHIHTLRSIATLRSLEEKLARAHRRYLTGEYDMAGKGNALVDDLGLAEDETLHIATVLGHNEADIPLDVFEHLREEFDAYHLIKFRDPNAINSEPIEFDAFVDRDDDDIIVADGGTDGEWQ